MYKSRQVPGTTVGPVFTALLGLASIVALLFILYASRGDGQYGGWRLGLARPQPSAYAEELSVCRARDENNTDIISRETRLDWLDYFRCNALGPKDAVDVRLVRVTNTPRPLFMVDSDQYPYSRSAAVEKATGNIMHMLFKEQCSRTPGAHLFLDMGSNDGFWAVLAASYRCRVITVEPQPQCVRNLALGLALNSLDPMPRLYNAIVSPVEGTEYEVDGNTCSGIAQYVNGGMKSVYFPTFQAQNTVKVKSLAVDTLLGDQDRVLLWHVDTEGAEMHVLRSGERAIREGRIQSLIVEYFPSRWGTFGVDIAEGHEYWKNIVAWGNYTCYHLDKFTSENPAIHRIDGWNLYKEAEASGLDVYCTTMTSNRTIKLPTIFPDMA